MSCFPRSLSVGSAGDFVPRFYNGPVHRSTAATSTVGAAPPAQPRLPPHQDEEADLVLPISAKMASQNGAPNSFFSFLRCEVEIPQRCDAGLKFPHGEFNPASLSPFAGYGSAPPTRRSLPASLPGFFRTKMAGLQSKQTSGLFPCQLPTHWWDLQSISYSHFSLCSSAPMSFRQDSRRPKQGDTAPSANAV